MVLLDGNALAQKILAEIKETVKTHTKRLSLAVIVIGEGPATRTFIAKKKKIAHELGIDFAIYPFEKTITTNELRKRLFPITHTLKNSGVIIQLPLPLHINTQYILDSVMPGKDVDVLSTRALGLFISGKSKVMPPVASAIKLFFEEYDIDYKNKNVVIIGAGTLVGKPAALWFLSEKAGFSLVEVNTPNPEGIIKQADILITGIGKPGYIKGDWIKKDAVVIDAGTSESRSKLVGDVDFKSASKKAGFITPVPGGVGPVTTAMIYKNLIALTKK